MWRRIKSMLGLGKQSLPMGSAYDVVAYLFDIKQDSTRYDWYWRMYQYDSDVYGAVNRKARLIQRTYHGIIIKPGRQLSDDEKRLLEQANRLATQLHFNELFFSIAKHLLIYGDDILYKSTNGQLVRLPIRYLTILESRNQIMDLSAQVFKRKLYVLNEEDESKRRIFTADEVLHFSIDPLGDEVYDRMGRYTFGVWSISPLEPIRTLCFFKQQILTADILWRARNVPRIQHKLDLSMFNPDRFKGSTLEERLNAARQAAQNIIDEYRQNVAQKKSPLQDWITDKSVEIEYIEPKTARYMSPNDLLDQMSREIYTSIGVSESAVRGRTRGTFASELVVSSYLTADAFEIARNIARVLLEYLKEKLREKFGDNVDKLDIKLQLILDIDRSELVRQVAVLRSTNILTSDELREMLGYEPLTDEQRGELQETTKRGRIGDHSRTLNDIVSKYVEREPGAIQEPVTPESKRQQQQT